MSKNMSKKKSPTASQSESKERSQRKEPNPGSQRSGEKGKAGRPDFDTNTVGHRQSDTNPPRKNEENHRDFDTEDETEF